MKKISKTARASLGQRGGRGSERMCPKCGEAMVATKIMRSAGFAGGMYWVCDKDNYQAPISHHKS